MNNVKNKQPRQLADENASLSKNDNVPAAFEENYTSREICDGITESYGGEDFSTRNNSNNLPGYVD